MRLTYWRIECADDSSAYDIREKTKRAAMAKYHEYSDHYGAHYHPTLERVTVQYRDGFELLNECLGEDRECGLIVERRTWKIPE